MPSLTALWLEYGFDFVSRELLPERFGHTMVKQHLHSRGNPSSKRSYAKSSGAHHLFARNALEVVKEFLEALALAQILPLVFDRHTSPDKA